ncbi:MAG TPA: Smr/MutS family protein [Syntrophales bacterium]|nr:Smr/MutS family protein [Syntrophales bacterium]HOX94061.1 Smr/MutS family protein [Syntrophales bacterium]HPI58091.1 Smr/MutS family protein [Syntrophales bacterium]HPN24626.1 Smr/MutS family protein [Syntrophales bacterium]HQM28931.1 Smr/MutS family protein [Syntrophales bacterium]
MKPPKSDLGFQPFENLDKRLRKKTADAAPLPAKPSRDKGIPRTETAPAADDEKIFLEAMAGVKTLRDGKYVEPSPPPVREVVPRNDKDEDLETLTNLVKYGEGFVISDTPEYIEGTGYRVRPEIARRLHQGEFSIQSQIDLHGMNVEEAEAAFEEFLRDSIDRGRKGILVIHGRGLSSPAEPVLKTRVVEWLTTGPWRKWVTAYSSARSCDGGTGATYVMLRQRPVTKRFKRR